MMNIVNITSQKVALCLDDDNLIKGYIIYEFFNPYTPRPNFLFTPTGQKVVMIAR